jgi:hypothetical protein
MGRNAAIVPIGSSAATLAPPMRPHAAARLVDEMEAIVEAR